MIRNLLKQLQHAANKQSSITMLFYHLGRIQGYSYSVEVTEETLACRNEAKFIVNDYAQRHGSK